MDEDSERSTIAQVKLYSADAMDDEAYDEIVGALRAGGVVAFPTDTAYGLGADPFNEAAIERIFEIKGRPETKPIPVIVSSLEMAQSIGRCDSLFYDVAEEFWPGPLTLVLPAAASLSPKLTAATHNVGLRWPNAPFATTLAARFGKPITATSANLSGMPSAITPDEVQAQIGTAIDGLIDGGTLPERGGSTILDLTGDPPVLLREGPIDFARLNGFLKGRIRRPVA